MRSLSAVASAITSPAEATMARFTCASSSSGVVTPTSGCSEQMRERTGRWRGGERAPVNAMQQALLGEVPQVAADGVLGDAEAGHELRGDDPAVSLDPLEDRLSAFSRQHLRVIARTCRFLRLTPRPSRRRT